MGDEEIHALRGVSISIDRGEYVAIMGPSGSGKSTLMNILGCLDAPEAGSYVLAGDTVGNLNDNALAAIRNKHIGFVFQTFNLLPRLNAIENVELPLIYGGDRHERRQRAVAALEQVGLGDRVHHRPSELSGGQQQRAAVARAVVSDPALLLADEPTGNLDSGSSAEVMALFARINAEGRTVVIITHEDEVASYATRVVRLRDGRVQSDERRNGNGRVAPTLTEVAS
jgi:putative ABC transport system ATP-binding protein